MTGTVRRSFTWALAIALATAGLLASTPPGDQVLTGRREQGVPACPPEYALGGIDAGGEHLWCRDLGAGPVDSQLIRSPGPLVGRRILLLCPEGWYMRGFGAGSGILCSHSRGLRPSDEISSPGELQPGDLRVCPDVAVAPDRIRVMTGIAEDGQELYCSLVDRQGGR